MAEHPEAIAVGEKRSFGFARTASFHNERSTQSQTTLTNLKTNFVWQLQENMKNIMNQHV